METPFVRQPRQRKLRANPWSEIPTVLKYLKENAARQLASVDLEREQEFET